MDARPIQPDAMTRMSAGQAALLGAIGRIGEVLSVGAPAIESVLARYAGGRVRIRTMAPVSPGDLESPPPPGGWSGVAATVRCIDPAARILVMVPGSLAASVAGTVLGCGSLPPSADPALARAALLLFLCDVVRCLPAGLPAFRVDSVADAPGVEALPLAGAGVAIHVRVSIAGRSDIATLVVPLEDLPALSRAAASSGLLTAGSAVRDLRCPVHVVAGAGAVSFRDLGGMEAGDVVVLDRVAAGVEGWSAGDPGPAEVDLAVGTGGAPRFVARAEIRGSGIRVVAGGPVVMEAGLMAEIEDRTVIDEAPGVAQGAARGGAADQAVRDFPAEVIVECGRIETTVGKLLDLAPGTVITMGRPPSMEVDLAVGGMTVAHGVLVSVEGEMGVQVLKIVR